MNSFALESNDYFSLDSLHQKQNLLGVKNKIGEEFGFYALTLLTMKVLLPRT